MRAQIAAVAGCLVLTLVALSRSRSATPPEPPSSASSYDPRLSELIALGHVNLGSMEFGGSQKAVVQDECGVIRSKIYLSHPPTQKAAETWARLGEEVSFNFPNDTPLEDMLKYVKKATAGDDGKGIRIYVEPSGLQEAEKTMSTPVVIDLDEIPLKTALELALKQLGLKFYVQDDGIVIITSEDDEGAFQDPRQALLQEVSDLRRELEVRRHATDHGESSPFVNQDRVIQELASLRRELEKLRADLVTDKSSTKTRDPAPQQSNVGGGFR